ncbi:MAG: M1 family aminopeptidase [bacterium]
MIGSKKTLLIYTFWTSMIVLLVGVSFSQEIPVSRDELQTIQEWEIETKQKQFEHHRLMKPFTISAAQNNFDVSYYKLNLNIDPINEQISGILEMRAMAKTNNFQTVELDFYSNMTVDSVSGDAASFNHNADILQIQLIQPRQSGDFMAVQVAYHGQPTRGGFGSFGFNNRNSIPLIWTLSEPYFARAWWPCKDTPNDKADSVDIIITVPENLIVASNGILISDLYNEDSTRTFHWHESYPITTYLVSLAITNYATYSDWFHYAPNDSMEVKYYIYPEALNAAQEQLTETLDMLSYFHEIFGPYPFLSEKYGIAQFPIGGGMEHQTITSQSGFDTRLTVHELAHQWWGDKITNANWHEIWLNEGFASYSEALYFEHTTGKEFYHTYMSWKDRDFPYAIYVDDTTSVGRIFHITVYYKGAWFLHMMRHVLGDSTFFDILLAYSQDPRFAYGNATTAGFQDVCELVSGKNLDWFFQPWIYEIGRPVYRVEWNREGSAGSSILYLRIEQMQYPQQALFPMPIDITVETVKGDTLVKVFNDEAVQVFTIPLKASPTGIVLDKEGWILKKVDSVIFTDKLPHIPSQFSLRQNYPNPFNRETVIEFSLPQRERIEITIYNIHGQKVRRLISQPYEAGTYKVTWNGKDENGNLTASGLFIYQMRAGNFKQQKKLLFIK